MNRYQFFRLLFVVLAVAAPVITTAPLAGTLPIPTTVLIFVPAFLTLVVLGTAMFFGWQGGSLAALFSAGVFWIVLLDATEQVTLSVAVALSVWGLFYLAVGLVGGLVFDEVNAVLGAPSGSVVVDPASGLHSERYLRERVAEELRRSRRYGHQFSVLIVSFGSMEGVPRRRRGLVLQKAALALYGRHRTSDTLCRYGDGLAIILPNTESSGAEIMGHRIESFFSHDAELRKLAGSLEVRVLTFPKQEADLITLGAPFSIDETPEGRKSEEEQGGKA